MALNLNVPRMHDEFSPRICVVGVGGAGGNAINNMITSGLNGVEFLVCNTDAQDLAQSLTENRVQLGPNTTQGLGAGMQPHIGANAAQESLEEILHHLEGANMVFVTAGMGGGTGTGAAPVIARALRDKNILTVGVVTKPFQFEGMKRATFAEEGIANMTEAVDTLIVIPNQNLFRLADERTTFADAFKMADNVLLDGVRSVSDLIVKPGIVNLDFADVRTLMTLMGKAMMGTGEGEGETRALDAANRAIANPLLDDMSLDGAQGVLINVSGGPDVTLYEVDVVANQIRNKVDPEANIIFGSSLEEDMDGAIRVSVVATGIDADAMAKSNTQSTPPPNMPGGPLGPGGPRGGPGSGPGGGQTVPHAATQPTPKPAAPMSPFGRSPFAFRSNNNNNNQGGPTSELTTGEIGQQGAMPASPAPRLAAAAGSNASNASLAVSPNYAPVPPANAATQGIAPPQPARPHPMPDLSLFTNAPPEGAASDPNWHAPAQNPQEMAPTAIQEAPQEQTSHGPQATFPNAPSAPAAEVSQQGLGGLFSRFAAPRQETAPSSTAQTAAPSKASPKAQMGAAVAEANASMGAAAHAATHTLSPQAQQVMAPTPPLADLDSQPTAPQNADIHGSTNAPRVVDLDDSASSGFENFDQSYKSVPAFLRHQNN